MYKKTLLSLAVASSVALTGCFEDANDNTNAGSRAKIQDSQFEGKTYPVFNPVTSELPVPNDLIFDSEAGDGSFDVSIPPGEEDNPVLNALNNLSGASTVAPAVLRFNGKIDASTVNSQSFILDPEGNPIPNPNQNVFLLETEYPSEEPVRALSAQEPPTLPVALTAQLAGGATLTAAQKQAVADLIGTDATPGNAGTYLGKIATNPRFDHDVVELDGTSALRIRPNQPLDPLKRYVVVVTNEVKDVNGDPISASPTYSKLTEDDGDPLGGALDTVRGLINNFWEATASSYFAVNNGTRDALEMDPISADDIAVSYSFTTSADEDILSYLARPALWIGDQVERSVTTSAASAAVESGASDFSSVRDAVNTAVTDFTPSKNFDNDGLTPCNTDQDDATDGFQTNLGSGTVTFESKFTCVGTLVKSNLNSNNIEFPEPSAVTVDVDSKAANVDAVEQSVLLDNFVDPTDILIHHGSITLPYYLKAPSSSDGSPIRTSAWTPDESLASAIASATGFDIPQADSEKSSVLNYNFPFPEKQKDIEVPLLTMTNANVDASTLESSGTDYPVVIFQHGITTDRSAALAFGSQLINAYETATGGGDLVVMAIDQPLHGIAPVSTEERLELAGTLLASADPSFNTEENRTAIVEGDTQTVVDNTNGNLDSGTVNAFIDTNTRAGSTIAGIDPVYEQAGINGDGVTERHFGYSANEANAPAEMNFDESAAFGSSGSLFINLTNFLNNRDNLRQGSLDMMNLRASLSQLNIDESNVYFVGHSLGTLNGGAFAGSVARAVQRTDASIQSSWTNLDSLDVSGTHLITPVAGITRLLENSPSFAPTILGGLQQAAGLSQGDADLETFLNVNQNTLDTVDPINFASDLKSTNILLSQVNGDRTTPNGADTRYSSNVEIYDTAPLEITFPNGLNVDSPAAPLSGSEPFQTLLGATNTGTATTATPAITRYTKGLHATPVFPRAETAEEGDVLKTREIAQGGEPLVTQGNASSFFGELVFQTVDLIESTATPKEVTGGDRDGSVIQN
ncbi:virulence factor lipase-like protein [Halospina denitrificans]|uniref:Virulence factor lipase-like protein n=1 Tax=Halospina denitrificans TaxID=332522 RepID=A0A4R7JX48_9GAMM|nr:hypothetical protein [Halospina denitrificans]TDT43040.1 virulence factor lipase-like protein [Halospina denitrificans]